MRTHIPFVVTALLLGSVPAAAQPGPAVPQPVPASPPAAHRFLVALNGGYQASSLSFADARRDVLGGETAAWTADYDVEAGPSFEAGAGVRVWRNLVATVGTSRFTETRSAGVSAQVPHPFFFDRPRSVTGTSPGLKHVERAVHVAAGWMIPATPRIQLTLFGGPSFFSITRDLIEDLEYSETYPYDEAAYEGAVVRSVSQSRTGFNAGADVSFFVTETVGVGGGVRFSRAQAQLRSPATGDAVAFDAGGAQAVLGLRLRFGASDR